jgi:5-methylcytosine-specific restriction protein A
MFSTSAWASELSRPNERRWRIVRVNYLAAHPMCEQRGCNAVAHEVDHVLNLKDHSELDPFDYGNLQALCVTHHRVKTGHEGARASAKARAQRLAHGRPKRRA